MLSRLFRRLFLERLAAAYQAGRLEFYAGQAALAAPAAFKAHLAALRKREWVVYAKRPFGGSTDSIPRSPATSLTKSTSSTVCWNMPPSCGRGSKTEHISTFAATQRGWPSDVDRSLAYIVGKEGGMDMVGAKAYLAPRPRGPLHPRRLLTSAKGCRSLRSVSNEATGVMTGPLRGRRIALLETREADRLAAMLREEGAEIIACPAVAIVLPADPAPALAWLGRFIAAPFDDLILLTGEGLYRLHDLSRSAGIEAAFLAALGRTRTVCRGPKPVRALRMLGQQPQLRAEEPTTDGVVALLSGLDLRGRRVGVQLYPDAGGRLVEFLEGGGAVPDPVTPYEYASRAADEAILALIDQLGAGAIDVIALTSAPQVRRLFHVAQSHGLTDPLLAGLGRTTIAAIGPVVAETLRRRGVSPAIMPRGTYFMKPLVSAIAAGMNAEDS